MNLEVCHGISRKKFKIIIVTASTYLVCSLFFQAKKAYLPFAKLKGSYLPVFKYQEFFLRRDSYLTLKLLLEGRNLEKSMVYHSKLNNNEYAVIAFD